MAETIWDGNAHELIKISDYRHHLLTSLWGGTNETWCYDTMDGFGCCRSLGHRGMHIAMGNYGAVAIWKNRPNNANNQINPTSTTKE